jgi:ribulose-5-phosphate 4-epimerase/fuculose-1-phosphate aldolase
MTVSTLKIMANDSSDDIAILKRDAAAAYRLIAHKGLDDLSDGFVSTRDPRDASYTLIGRYGALPQQVRAEDIIRAKLEADPPIVHFEGADVDAVLFSLAVYESSSEFNAVIHAHPKAAMVFAALNTEIQPISQTGVMFYKQTRSIPFDENVSNAGIRTQIAEAIKSGAKAIIMENHGLIVPGRTIADAFIRLYRLNQAMETQLAALNTGVPLRTVDMAQVESWSKEYWRNGLVHNDGTREWPAFLKLLRESDPTFDQ